MRYLVYQKKGKESTMKATSKNKTLRIIVPLMFIAILINQIAIYLYEIFGKSQNNETLTEIHAFAGLCFIILAIIHLILNWSWVKSQVFGIKKTKQG
ncbi:MAG: hypothetical protein PWP64_1212 [Candidatus Cloacimonadota bacterium]|nr:hypothetical protein [Candidatus Cloacimonadota bacterium]